MKKKYIIINSFLILIGIICSLSGELYSIGTLGELGIAFITGGLTSLITTFLITENNNDDSLLKIWGLVQIYKKRSEMNNNCDRFLEKSSKQLDFISMGLKNFRDATTDVVIKKIKSGVRIRIITSNPDSMFLKQKAIEEGGVPESVSQSIVDLIEWAKDINSKTFEGAIQIKVYDALPMFSYQRIDDHVFVGPNLYGLSSQKCISYEYHKGKGTEYFTNYFEKLWNDTSIKKVV